MTTVMVYSTRSSPAQPLLHKSFGPLEPDVVRNTSSVARVVEEALTLLAESAGKDRVTLGLRIRSANIVEAGLDWIGFNDSLQRMSKYLGQSMKSFARKEVRAAHFGVAKAIADNTVGQVPVSFKFDHVDELALGYSEKQTGQLIAGITADTRDNVRKLVGESLSGNLTVDQLGRKLRTYIPLHPTDVAAVEKYADKQFTRFIAEGKTLDQASDASRVLSEKLAARKLRSRSTTIARTELTTAANQGRYAGWEASVSGGDIAPNSLKEWVAAPGACPRCQALDGQLAYWNAEFPNGMIMPPDHPRCRCSAVILPPDDDIIAAMEQQFSSGDDLTFLRTPGRLHSPLPTSLPETLITGDRIPIELPKVTPPDISDTAMRKRLNAEMLDPTTLGFDERGAIGAYTGLGARGINEGLRAGAVSSVRQTAVDGIDAVMKRSALPDDMDLYRKVSAQFLPDDIEGMVGSVLVDDAYLSTSMRIGGFAEGSAFDPTIVISAPKGTKALWMRPISQVASEDELLLPRGTRLGVTKVTKKEINGRDRYMIYATVVPDV